MAFADDRVVAFMDLGAVTPGHVLVVPRLHAAGLEDLDEETSVHVWRIGHRIGRALRQSGLRCEGVNVFLADGKAALQEIFHFHLHVFPRFAGDGFRIGATGRPVPATCSTTKPGTSGKGCLLLASLVRPRVTPRAPPDTPPPPGRSAPPRPRKRPQTTGSGARPAPADPLPSPP